MKMTVLCMMAATEISGGVLQATQTGTNAGVCSDSCVRALDSVCLFVCLFVVVLHAIKMIGCREWEVGGLIAKRTSQC